MKRKLHVSILLLVALAAWPITAQQAADNPGNLGTQGSCHTVALAADNPSLPYRLFAPYLEKRADFQASRLELNDEPLTADVSVQLSAGEIGSTRIRVTNRLTHETLTTSSSWTDYPGMVAMDVMNELKRACQGTAVLVVREGAVAPLPTPDSDASGSTAGEASHGHGFKHVMGRTAYYAGQVIEAAAEIAGYTAYGIAVSAAMQ